MGRVNFSHLVLSCLSATLVFLALPGAIEIPILAWISLVPIIYVFAFVDARKAAYNGFVFGCVFYGLNFYWILSVEKIPVLAWGLTALILGFCHFSLLGLTVGISRKYFPKLFLVNFALLYLLFDFFVRENVFSLPILNLAESQYRNLSLIQGASIGGIYAIEFLILLGNVFFFILLSHLIKNKKIKAPLFVGYSLKAAFVLLLVAFLIYGKFFGQGLAESGEKIKVSAIQPNFLHGVEGLQESVERYETLADLSSKADNSDLIIWPEVSINSIMYEEDTNGLFPLDPEIDLNIKNLARELDTPIIFGTNVLLSRRSGGAEGKFYNSSVLVLPSGEMGWYAKKKLLWGAEYMPGVLGPIKEYFNGKGWGLKTIGRNASVLEVSSLKFGNLICSENGHGDYVREQVELGAQFLINPTDDSSFRDRNVIDQHRVVNIFRAIESGRYVMTAGNVGATGVVDTGGNTVSLHATYEPGVVTFEVPLEDGETFFVKYGNLVINLAIVILVAQVLIYFSRRKN